MKCHFVPCVFGLLSVLPWKLTHGDGVAQVQVQEDGTFSSKDDDSSSFIALEEVSDLPEDFTKNGSNLPSSPPAMKGYVDSVVRQYEDLIKSVVDYQTKSWNFVTGITGIDEAALGLCPKVYDEAYFQNKKARHQTKEAQVKVQDFLWDDERDISVYFDKLMEGCSLNAVKHPTQFGRDCYEYLFDLVYTPRCTTMFDTRQVCKRGNSERTDYGGVDYVESLFQTGHFSSESLNVVIIGAGPVGLFLANALAEANRRRNGSSVEPPIHVTLFDNRVHEPGMKRIFTRNWQTLPEVQEFINIVDRRVGDFFKLVSNDGLFAAPLNAIEALLFMSCRERGVKFVYDANYDNYMPLLQEKVPNLLVFDATGHRLDTLKRGSHCNAEGEPVAIQTVSEWKPNADGGPFDWFSVNTYRELLKFNHTINIGEQDGLLYPLDTETGKPFSAMWLHVHDIPESVYFYELHDFWSQRTRKTDMCKACDVEQEKGKEYPTDECRTFCKMHDMFSSESYFRDDIQTYLMGDDLHEPQDVWFAKRGANVLLTAEQALALSEIIHQAGYDNDPIGMPIVKLPLKQMVDNPVFRENRLLQALAALRRHARSDQPLISVFQHRPYCYRDGVVRDSALFPGPNKPPVLRVGDSLLTGDPNRSSGLVTHLWLIRTIACRIRNESDWCNEV